MEQEPAHKWRMMRMIAAAELLVMAVWFSASAVVPLLTEQWALTEAGQAWLTMSVQIGFVVGAFGSAVLNLADRIATKRLFVVSALVASLATALIPLVARDLSLALILRFLTGVFLAGVYPVGMKLITTWTRSDRGFGIGLLVGALVLGSAAPHLLKVFGGVRDWQPVLYLAAGSALLGAVIGALFIQEGPFRTASAPFNWRYIGQVVTRRELLLPNLGYLGHMWELYAMWTWIPAFLLASFALAGVSATWASLVAFLVIGAGALGSLLAGKLADQIGRTTVTIGSMVMSATTAIVIGPLYGGSPVLVALVAVLWGFTVVADSAQFSACVTELCDRKYTGTALTIQTSLGFLLTLVTIRLVPTLQGALGWRGAFIFLALGPIVGIGAMLLLRRIPESAQLAGGQR